MDIRAILLQLVQHYWILLVRLIVLSNLLQQYFILVLHIRFLALLLKRLLHDLEVPKIAKVVGKLLLD